MFPIREVASAGSSQRELRTGRVVDDRTQTAIGLAEQVLAVLEDGKFSATYKYALFLALTDLCIENGASTDQAPAFTTRQLARRVLDIYWSHSREFPRKGVLRQSGSGIHRIVKWVEAFRRDCGIDDLVPLRTLESMAEFQTLLDKVEAKLIEDPIPRLQVLQGRPVPFLYDCPWTLPITPRTVRHMVREGRGPSNVLQLRPGVAEGLIRLNGVLRPLVEREWARRVAKLNSFAEADVHEFLFDSPRLNTSPLRSHLRRMQSGRCFFCAQSLDGQVHVDHFLPRARYADDSIDNLVLSDSTCNSAKKALLPSAAHVSNWVARFADPRLDEVVSSTGWSRDRSVSINVATALYRRLPEGARLWHARTESTSIDVERETILRLLRQLAG